MTSSLEDDGEPLIVVKRTRAKPPEKPTLTPEPVPAEVSQSEFLKELGNLAIKLGEAIREVKDWMARHEHCHHSSLAPGWLDQVRAEEKFLSLLRSRRVTLPAKKDDQP